MTFKTRTTRLNDSVDLAIVSERHSGSINENCDVRTRPPELPCSPKRARSKEMWLRCGAYGTGLVATLYLSHLV